MAGNLHRLVLGDVLTLASRQRLTGWLLDCKTGENRLRGGLPKGWKVGDKTGNNGKDASGDIAVAWPQPGAPVLICSYTAGGSPTAPYCRPFSLTSAGWWASGWADLLTSTVWGDEQAPTYG